MRMPRRLGEEAVLVCGRRLFWALPRVFSTNTIRPLCDTIHTVNTRRCVICDETMSFLRRRQLSNLLSLKSHNNCSCVRFGGKKMTVDHPSMHTPTERPHQTIKLTTSHNNEAAPLSTTNSESTATHKTTTAPIIDAEFPPIRTANNSKQCTLE